MRYRRTPVKPLSPETLEEIQRLKESRNNWPLSEILLRTRNPLKAEAAAKALGEIGTTDAKKSMLLALRLLSPHSDVIWPSVIPLLSETDIPSLLEIEREARRNPRMAAKYKLPEEARGLIVSYLKSHIEDIPYLTLLEVTGSRYPEISDTTFNLLLEHDGADIRKALRTIMYLGLSDGRKMNPRAMAAFEELRSRLPARQQRNLLLKAYESFSRPLAKKAGELLKKRDKKSYLRMVRDKYYLSADDIRALKRDGSPESISRIIEEANGLLISSTGIPDKVKKQQILAIIYTLGGVKTTEARRALVSILKKFKFVFWHDYQECIIDLCDVLAARGERYVLPALRDIADNSSDLKTYAAISAILSIENVSPYDENHKYARMAREALARDKESHAKERERMSTPDYFLLEDPDVKMSDKGALRAGDQTIQLYEYLVFDRWSAKNKGDSNVD